MYPKKISKKKEIGDSELWMYDEDVNNAIKEFARIQGDDKYQYSKIKNIISNLIL